MVIKSIEPVSAAKIAGIIYALLGVLVGLFLALGSGFLSAVGDFDMARRGLGIVFGAGALVVMPVFYGVLGFIGGLLFSIVYNLVAGWTGGLQVELEDSPSL